MSPPEMPPPMAMPPPMEMAPKKRPGAVTAAAILMLIFGILGLLGSGANYAALSGVTIPTEYSWVLMVILGILIFSLLQVVFSIGILGLKKWAWIGGLVITGLHLAIILTFLLGFAVVATSVLGAAGGFLVGLLVAVCALPLIIDILIIVLLILKGSRQAFE